VQNVPLPAGSVPGINYINSNTVTLALFAPYKEFAYVIGSFNDWKVNTNYFMKKHQVTADSVVWWITLNGITPGQETIFQYLVDGTIRIADPYTEKVSDPDDSGINGSTYPNLIPYPYGKTGYPATVIQTNQTPYQWQVTNFQGPAKTDLIIYELLIRDFLAAHKYSTLEDTLNYLKNLGVNAIELMPVTEFEGNESWGYNISFHLAADKYYGPREDLKSFIDKAHEMGFAVIIDMVLNHSYNQNPLARLYWNTALGRPAANNPWFNEVSPNPVYAWGNDFDHTSIHTKNYVDRVTKYWLTEYNADGFRFDFSKGFTNTPGDGWPYDAARIAILKRMADKIWEVKNDAYVILEHFTANNEEIELSDYGAMIWGNLNSKYSEAAMGYHDNGKSDFSGASYKVRGWNYPHLVAYMESHDEERMMFRNKTYGNSSGTYNIKDIRVGLNRIKLAASFFLTIPGPKMIWQFEELGYDISIDDPCRVCNKPILWNYFNDMRRRNVYKVFAALNDLKKNYDVFRTTDFEMSVAASGKRINLYHPSMDVTIIGNFGVTSGTQNPNFSRTGIWYDFFSGDSIEVTNTTAQVFLEPGEFHIYSTFRLPPPEPGILLDVEEIQNELPVTDFYLEQNYPNPFNPSTEIIFQVKEPSIVSLKIYDILGREVKTLVNEQKNSGTYKVTWNGDDDFNKKVSTGIYFYKMDAGAYTSVRKMMLIK
jgi:1,4-alpha-glucan branching enzyme